ncbi:hypothetical protein HPB49_017104 [Dermacentor silvarum]|uniref:Uncharacterized protein n=1 Tax=Dermacentor silvarum TaxID=543639 RepID=A0ACB8CSL6_DERSI|nr:hypothetical protein HPB49_017104 [Dermacentor silvarum]
MSEAEAKPAAATPKAKGRKSAAGGAKKAKKPASHPKYTEMVKKSIEALKERGGSSRRPSTTRLFQSACLKRSKGTGASGSFRLAEKATAGPRKLLERSVAQEAAAGAAEAQEVGEAQGCKVSAKKAAKQGSEAQEGLPRPA